MGGAAAEAGRSRAAPAPARPLAPSRRSSFAASSRFRVVPRRSAPRVLAAQRPAAGSGGRPVGAAARPRRGGAGGGGSAAATFGSRRRQRGGCAGDGGGAEAAALRQWRRRDAGGGRGAAVVELLRAGGGGRGPADRRGGTGRWVSDPVRGVGRRGDLRESAERRAPANFSASPAGLRAEGRRPLARGAGVCSGPAERRWPEGDKPLREPPGNGAEPAAADLPRRSPLPSSVAATPLYFYYK